MASDLQWYSIIVLPTAESNLDEITSYILSVLKSPMVAKNISDSIREEILSLHELPDRGIPIQAEPWKSKGMRFVPVENYDVYYVVKETTVYVFAVLYSRRNKNELFNELELREDGKVWYSGNVVCEPQSRYGSKKKKF